MKKSFGDRLESLRGGKTQKEFAKTLGIPLTSYTNWVLGLRQPNIDAVARICSQLGISSDWLLGLNDRHSEPITATNSAVNTNGNTRINVSAPVTSTSETNRLLAIIERQQETIDRLLAK